MIDPKNIEIEDREFQLLKMTSRKASKLDIRVMKILSPALGALDGLAMVKKEVPKPEGDEQGAPDAPEDEVDFDIKFDKLAVALGSVLGELDSKAYDALLREMFAEVTGTTLKGGALPMDSDKNIDLCMEGMSPMATYRLLYEVARFNKFSPFALAENGSAMSTILGFVKRA